MNARTHWLMAVLGGLCLVLACISLSVGPVSFSPGQFWRGLAGAPDSVEAIVLWQIRLPRTELALIVGAVLGLAGAAMQGLFRNPLAEPGVIGVSGCAALGAVLAFYSGLAAIVPLALPLGGIIGAGLAGAVLVMLAGRRFDTVTLLLAGVALTSLAGALTALAINLSPNPFATVEAMNWLMGGLADRSSVHVLLAAPLAVLGAVAMMSQGRALDALSLGEDAAGSLGIDLARAKTVLIGGAALAVGAVVSVSGSIAFVGLVVPHLLRPAIGHLPSRLLGVSALGGAALTLLADMAVRAIPTDSEVRLGVATALLGAPFFLWLILRGRRAA